MVLYGLVKILKLKSKPLMNGRGYVVRKGRGYGVIQNNESVSQRGRHRAARAAKKLKFKTNKVQVHFLPEDCDQYGKVSWFRRNYQTFWLWFYIKDV